MKQGWEIIPFEDSIVKVKYTTKIPSNDYLEQGLYPIVSQEEGLISGYWNNEEDVFKVSSPVVIFGDHTRILKFVDFDFVLGADGVKILQPIENINAKFFKLYLESCKIPSLGYSRHYKLLKELQIPIPPRDEQERIVEILDREFEKIDALKENAEKNLQHAKDLFQSALKQELQPKEGWSTNKLNKVASYSIGLTYKPTDVSSLGTIVLRSSNIQNNKLCLNDIVRVNCAVKEHLFVGNGDILMCSRNGSAKLVGKVAVIDNIQEPMTFGTFMTIIKSEYNPLLLYFFMSKEFRKQINKGENTMINQITKYMLDDIIVSLPNNKSTMYEIVARLDKLQENCRTLEENYTKTIALCDDMKQALLRKAFNGEL